MNRGCGYLTASPGRLGTVGAMRRVGGAVAVVGMLLLSGCGGSDPMPTLPPTPSSTPVFASEEEALAAAEEAYAAYLAMSNLISSEGGADPERIAPFVSESRLADELEGFETYQNLQIHTAGTDTYEVRELQRVDETEAGAEVVVYVCWDASAVRVIDASGMDVTPASREVRALLEVVLVTVDRQLPLVLDSDTAWPSESC